MKMSWSSTIDGDEEEGDEVGDGDEARVGAQLWRWIATNRKGMKSARMGEENPRKNGRGSCCSVRAVNSLEMKN